MNKIFKVIFNKTTGKMVVVSELTKSNGKSASQVDERSSIALNAIAGAAILGAAVFGSQAMAAAVVVGGGTTQGSGATTATTGEDVSKSVSQIAIGDGASALKKAAIAIGSASYGWNGTAKANQLNPGANASGEASIALGSNSIASNTQAIAIGEVSNAEGSQSISIGGNTHAKGTASIVIGGDDADGTDYQTWGYNSATGQVEAGAGQYQTATANGNLSIVIGTKAQTMNDGAIAIGTVATAAGKESISIGAKSAAKGTNATAVGANASAVGADASAYGSNSLATGNNSTALGMSANASTDDSTAVGKGAQATGANSTSMGSGATASAGNSVAIGMGASSSNSTVGSIAIGKNANSSANGASAIGTSSVANATYAHAYGDTTKVHANHAIAVGLASTVNTGANYATMLGGWSSIGENSANAVTVGAGNHVNSANATALGANISISTGLEGAVVLGQASGTAGSHTIATETGATVNGVTYSGFKGVASTVGRFVSVGSTGNERKIINVAAGNVSATSTEAINGSQLYMVANEVGNVSNVANNAKTAADQATAAVANKADATRAYTFNISNGDTVQNKKTGQADQWTLGADDTITFGATSNLSVSTDANGKIIYDLSSTFADKITNIETTANDAKTVADAAKATADTAKATADDAKATADTAKATADDAKATADTAKATADTAKATADTAKATADDAKATADTAKATADDAKATADDAKAIAGTGKDGKDGSTGTADAAGQGLTGKDGLNGKDLTTKVNALRNGEAGPVVYTDADGNRLVKANDGKYYPADQVEDNGEPKADATPEANPIASVVNPDGSTTAPTTMGNIKSTIGLDGKDAKGANQGPITADAAKTAVAGADGKSGLLAKSGPELNKAATVGDLQALAQAGLDFTGNNNGTTVHRALGTKLTVEGEGSTEAGWKDKSTAANNLYVEADATNNKLVVKMASDLANLTSVAVVDPKDPTKSTTLTPTGTTVKDGKKEATYGVDGVGLKGEDGKTTTLGRDKDGNLTVQKGNEPAVALATQGISGNGADGKDGSNGKTGASVTGPTGKDGLNGKDLTAKVNALRNGEAGPVVYTNAAGDRLVKANDGKYYPANQVNPDGTLKTGAKPEANPIASVVNPDGSTTAPTTMGNIKSTIGLDGKDAKGANQGPIKADAAKTAVAGADGKSGLLAKSGPELNNAATVGDLQALAQAGLDFTGNNAAQTTLHRPLGTKLVVEGESTKTDVTKASFGATAADNIHVEAKLDGDTNKLVVSLAEDLKGINKVDFKPTEITNPDGTKTYAKAEISSAGNKYTETDKDGVAKQDGKTAEYGLNGATVTEKDPATGETKTTTMDADGTHATVKDKDGNPTKSADYTADGSTVSTIDPTTGKPTATSSYGADGSTVTKFDPATGNATASSTYGADGLSTKALDPTTGAVTGETTVSPTGVNLYGKDGKDGKDAQPVASLTNTVDAAGNNNPSLSFAKDDAGNGTGAVTGLKDLERNPDGTAKDKTAAANAGYVDDRLAEVNAGKPFEYFEKDPVTGEVKTDANGNPVVLVRGKDGKFYKDGELDGKTFDPTTGTYKNADGTPLATTPVDSNNVTVQAMPSPTGAPIEMGNVGSGLGLDDSKDGNKTPLTADDAKAAIGGADGKSGLLGKTGDSLNNVATVKDLQALAQAGLDFTGNNSDTTVHRPLSTKLTVEGEGSWNGANSAANNLYVEADATNNKLVVKMNKDLTGLSSVETTDAAGNVAKMTAAGTTVTDTEGNTANYGAKGATVADAAGNTANYGANGSTVTDAAGNTANYGANGSTVTDAVGNTASYDANGLTVKDAAGNAAITLVNGDTGPSLNFAKNADGTGTGKITGVAAGDITPDSTDVVTGAQVYALSGGNNVSVNPDGSTTTTLKDANGNLITDESGSAKVYTLKTYNVEGQTEFVTNSVISAVHNMNEQGIKFFHTNDGVVKPINQSDNTEDSSAAGAYATAIGFQASASGTQALAIGHGSKASGEQSIAIGTGNQVTGNHSGAIGDPNTVSGERSYVYGNDNTVTTNNTFVVGNNVTTTAENSVVLGNKSAATAGDGSKTASLKNKKTDGTAGTTTTAGSTGTVSTATVGNMTYGGFAGATADGAVSVGAAGNERRVQNVAAGEISATSTDAINGSQLYSVADKFNNKVNALDDKLNRNNKKLRGGIAATTAMANIPQVTLPGKSALGAGVGTYDGQSAVAVGYSRMSDNSRFIIKLSAGATTQGKFNAGAGVAYQW